DRIEWQLVVQTRTDRDIGDISEHDRVTVGRCLRDDLHPDIAVRAGAVVDHHLLSERFRELVPEHSRERVRATPGCERHDEPNRLRACCARALSRQTRNRPCASGKTTCVPAEKPETWESETISRYQQPLTNFHTSRR